MVFRFLGLQGSRVSGLGVPFFFFFFGGGVQGLGFKVQGFRVLEFQGLGFRARVLGFTVLDSEFRVLGLRV